MHINVIYDSSTKSAPAGFFTAVQAAVNYWDATIENPITLTMQFGYGKVDGQAIDSGALAENIEEGYYFNYSDVVAGLASTAFSAADHTSVATLGSDDPTNGGQFFVTAAEADVLGLVSSPNFTVGYVGLSTAYPMTFDPNNRAVSGEFDAIGALEHEISEVLGRIGTVGTYQNQGVDVYDPLDLFRYSAPGVRALTAGPGWFSIDGQTLLQPFNNPLNGGDVADWLPSIEGDSFGDGYPGVEGVVTPVDLTVMDILGYDIAGTTTGSLTGLERQYTVGSSAGAVTVSGGPEGASHTLSGVTSIQFADGTLSFDPNGDPAQVYRLYDSALGSTWISAKARRLQVKTLAVENGGLTLNQLADKIAASPAFLADTAGMSNTQLINYLFETAAGRAPTSSETTTWTSFLAAGNTVGDLILGISQLPDVATATASTVAAGLWTVSPTYEAVEYMFQAALGRAPDAAEFTSWAAQLSSGMSVATFAQDITQTAEFQADTSGMSASQIVNLLYQNAFGQPPGAAATAWTSFLAAGGAVSTLVLDLEQDPTAQKHNQADIVPGVAYDQITPGGGSQLFVQAMAGTGGGSAAVSSSGPIAGRLLPNSLAALPVARA